jgi:hypothetical protein
MSYQTIMNPPTSIANSPIYPPNPYQPLIHASSNHGGYYQFGLFFELWADFAKDTDQWLVIRSGANVDDDVLQYFRLLCRYLGYQSAPEDTVLRMFQFEFDAAVQNQKIELDAQRKLVFCGPGWVGSARQRFKELEQLVLPKTAILDFTVDPNAPVPVQDDKTPVPEPDPTPPPLYITTNQNPHPQGGALNVGELHPCYSCCIKPAMRGAGSFCLDCYRREIP